MTQLDVHESGTVVIWEQFDRLKQGASKVQKAFDEMPVQCSPQRVAAAATGTVKTGDELEDTGRFYLYKKQIQFF